MRLVGVWALPFVMLFPLVVMVGVDVVMTFCLDVVTLA